MTRLIAALALFIFSISAHAINSEDVRSAGFNKLSATDQAKVIAQVEQMSRGGAIEKSEAAVDKAERWVNIGSRIGQGLAGAAKELGVAANDFAKSPVGMIATGLIVWHFVGQAAVHIVGGILVWIIGLSIVLYYSRRSVDINIKYNENGKRQSYHRGYMSSDAQVGYSLLSAVVIIGGLVTIFTF